MCQGRTQVLLQAVLPKKNLPSTAETKKTRLGIDDSPKMTIAILLTLQKEPMQYYYYVENYCNTIAILLFETYFLVLGGNKEY